MRLSTILRPSILVSVVVHAALVATAVLGTSSGGGGAPEEPGLHLVAIEMPEPEVAMPEPEPPPGDVIPVDLSAPDLPLETDAPPDDVPELEAGETISVPVGLARDVPPIGVRVTSPRASRGSGTPGGTGSGRAAPAAVPAQPRSRTIVPPRPLATNQPPTYPADALANGWEGLAFFHVTVAADGRVVSVRLETSSGYPVLDAAADTAIRGWLFTPALIDGIASEVTVRVPVRFRL